MEPLLPVIEKLTTHHDERGSLTELIHCYDLPQEDVAVDPFDKMVVRGRFGQVYIVQNPQAGIIRAFHRHKRLFDYFTIVTGSAKFWAVCPDSDKEASSFILTAISRSRLTVPPMWWHGWESLEPNTTLICTGTEVYDQQNPDEERCYHTSFAGLGVYWGVKPK